MRLDEEVFEFDREDDEIESEYDTENVDAELSEQAQRQLLKEQQLIDELEADAAENPIEDDRPDEDSERKNSNGNCKQKLLPVWRMPQERYPI